MDNLKNKFKVSIDLMGGDNSPNKTLEGIDLFVERYKKKNDPGGLGVGMKISLDLISPIIVGILIGLGFDKFFSTKPIFFLIFLLLGIITGFMSVIRSMKSLK